VIDVGCGVGGPARRAALALDNAGWHGAKAVALLDEPVANRVFADLDALEAALAARCRTLEADRPTVKAHTRFHWWPRERRRRRQL